MTTTPSTVVALLALVLSPFAALAEPVGAAPEPPNPAFERLKSLAGDWAGTDVFDMKRVK